MPDYFFHVAIEVCSNPDLTVKQAEPPNLSYFFKSLRPFTNRSPRTTRDHHLDRKREFHTQQAQNIRGAAEEPASNRIPHNPSIRPSAADDHRFDTVYVDSVDMTGASKDLTTEDPDGKSEDLLNRGIGSNISTSYLKGRFSHTSYDDSTAASWGIVHLYRDAAPTPSLAVSSSRPYQSSDLWSNTPQLGQAKTPHPPPTDAECTTLCILAVPSYMTPSDFLAFVGPGTREAVSHFRMLRTQRQNRYMVLMKFREGKIARKWQAEWNGKVWNAMEPETCHVVFLKSVELVATTSTTMKSHVTGTESSYPEVAGDPFMPSSATSSTRPLAPPTPSLVELPTCPVCLERMDETTGLLTIPCQHVFHCTCLQKWSGGGCPVCRYTHDDFSSRSGFGKKTKKTKKLGKDGSWEEYEVDDGVLECETCHEDGGSLWQCLICGKVGCGRYEGKHAFTHYEESGHLFAMDLASKRVWDYAGDGYVHRIMVEERSADKDGVEVGVREVTDSEYGDSLPGKGDPSADIENLALEYTHLLTSQLDSQRVYFEEIVERAVDKATEASKKAEHAEAEARGATDRLRKLEADNDFVTKGKVPELEKERDRWQAKARKLEDMAKDINSKYLEEKAAVKGLMSRIQHLESTELAGLRNQIQSLQEDNATKDLLMEGLREEHRDAMVQVSAERQLREMVERGEIEVGELEGAEVSVGKRPLTARERLQERIQTERQVRSGKKGIAKAADEKPKSKQQSQAAEVPSSERGLSATDSLLDTLLASSSDGEVLTRGDAYDNDRARGLLAEMRQKMLDLGLLKLPPTTDKADHRAVDEGGAAGEKQKQTSGEDVGLQDLHEAGLGASSAAPGGDGAGRRKGRKGKGRR
ncbi:uncharacterized protein HMPREF1541_10613 [Cyphellophora europaea CBS 101466]|uniref:RING-type domain-containing protein n=1 Tax=Cyphellophora europaea (strain CBS 101466) TaxID=1220924 RepID=W2S6Y7_CYPE1|nr:uncharacterized protein HMPREF1541_10613 [Cyphellophora europaea CBS 101466]ETN44432.1 hypothetical protein HMPREF1541_10613 [Cyphellophora europaea CBS 101466]